MRYRYSARILMENTKLMFLNFASSLVGVNIDEMFESSPKVLLSSSETIGSISLFEKIYFDQINSQNQSFFCEKQIAIMSRPIYSDFVRRK